MTLIFATPAVDRRRPHGRPRRLRRIALRPAHGYGTPRSDVIRRSHSYASSGYFSAIA